MQKIHPLKETVMPLSDLGKHLPGRPRYKTLLQWCQEGRINWNTRRKVKMELINLPSGKASSLEAYLRFIDALNSLD